MADRFFVFNYEYCMGRGVHVSVDLDLSGLTTEYPSKYRPACRTGQGILEIMAWEPDHSHSGNLLSY